MTIAGRWQEKKLLQKIYKSPKSSFLAVYGRRRIGKTFLIRELFTSLGPTYEFVGQNNAPLAQQLTAFQMKLREYFPHRTMPIFKALIEALMFLNESLGSKNERKITLFFDELPWFCHRKSNFLSALDFMHYLAQFHNI